MNLEKKMVWLIGFKGMLGSEVARQLSESRIGWIGSGSEVDISNPAELDKFARSHDVSANRTGRTVSRGTVPEKIAWVINCAAMTDAEEAEKDPDKAERTNATGPLNIARITRQLGAKLIHISTSMVFDGGKGSPYTEEDQKNPLSVYGKTKSIGEDMVEKEMTTYYILRTSWLYGFDGKNSVYDIVRGANLQPEVEVSEAQRGTPTSAADLAQAMVRIIQTSEKAKSLFGKKSALPYGVYNFAGPAEVSRYEFALKVHELGRKYSRITHDSKIVPAEDDGERFCVSLDSGKLLSSIKLRIPSWEDSLEKFMKSASFDLK